MSSSKSQIKPIVRQHAPQSLLLLPKKSKSASRGVPERAAAAGTDAAECTTMIADIAIYANMITNVVSDATTESGYKMLRWTGKDFVDRLLCNVRDAFANGYDTVVLCADKQAWTTEAKEYTQSKRSEQQQKMCERLNVAPLVWDSDAPTLIVRWDEPMPPICAVRATRTAFRYVIYQALRCAMQHYCPPPGCRLIIDMQPYAATNPETVDDWLTCDPSLEIVAKHRDEVEQLRARLRAIEHLPTWRHAARQLSTELGRAGKIRVLPWCIECSIDGVPIKPFVLRAAHNTCGEADLGVWRWVAQLYPANKARYLAGTREIVNIATDGSNAQFYSAEQRRAALEAAAAFCNTDVYMGRGGASVDDAQRSLVLTRDTDFFSGGVLWYARSVCDYVHAARTAAAARHEAEPPLDALLPALARSAPFVNFGDAYATATGYVQNACVYGTLGELKSAERPLQCVHELLNVARLFEVLCFNAHAPPPLRDSDGYAVAIRQQQLADAERKLKRKRGEKLPKPPKKKTHYEPSLFPTQPLAPLGRTDAPARWLERMLTFVAYSVTCGNDYLVGLCGVTHATMWRALVEYLAERPRRTLVSLSGRLHRVPPGKPTTKRNVPPSKRALLLDPREYTRFVAYCYHAHLCNYTGKFVPTLPPSKSSYSAVDAIVCNKYKNAAKYHMPDERTLTLMYERALWNVYYVFYGPEAVESTLDAPRIGWPRGLRREAV